MMEKGFYRSFRKDTFFLLFTFLYTTSLVVPQILCSPIVAGTEMSLLLTLMSVYKNSYLLWSSTAPFILSFLSFFFFWWKTFLLKYSWFSMLCYFLVYSKVIQPIYRLSFFFQILLHYNLLQGIEYSSLCYMVGPCCLSTLFIGVYVC